MQRLASILPSALNVAHSCPAAFFMYAIILNHALLMGGEEIRGTHIAPLGHVAVWGTCGICGLETLLAASVAVGSFGVRPHDVAGHSLALYIPTTVRKYSGTTHGICETLNPGWCFQCRVLSC